MDKISLEIRFKIALISVVIGFIVGFSLGEKIDEKTIDMGPAIGFSLVFGILGFSAVPMIIFEFLSASGKLNLICGSIGISFIKLAIKVFGVDGKISKNKIEHLKSYMEIEYGDSISAPLLKFISENKRIAEPLYIIAIPLIDVKLSDKVDILQKLISLVVTDRIYNEKEERLLKEIAKTLKIGRKRFDIVMHKVLKAKGYAYNFEQEQAKQSHSRNFYVMDQLLHMAYNPYAVLEVDQNGTNDEVKKAYRKMVKRYHPDRSMQENEEIRKQDAVKILEINEAYEAIKKMRGIS